MSPYRVWKEPDAEKEPFWTEGKFEALFVLVVILGFGVAAYLDPEDHRGQECAHAMPAIDCDRHGEHCRAREECDLWISPSHSEPGKIKEPVPR